MKKLLAAILFLPVYLCSGIVNALPITGTSGETIIFNFDFTGETPAPAYFFMSINWTFDTPYCAPSGCGGIIKLLPELDGLGDALGGLEGDWDESGYTTGFGLEYSSIVDGLFSMSFTSTSGEFTITSIQATGYGANQSLVQVTPSVFSATNPDPDPEPDLDPVPVPVPATIALFGIGLAGLGWSRRKKA